MLFILNAFFSVCIHCDKKSLSFILSLDTFTTGTQIRMLPRKPPLSVANIIGLLRRLDRLSRFSSNKPKRYGSLRRNLKRGIQVLWRLLLRWIYICLWTVFCIFSLCALLKLSFFNTPEKFYRVEWNRGPDLGRQIIKGSKISLAAKIWNQFGFLSAENRIPMLFFCFENFKITVFFN